MDLIMRLDAANTSVRPPAVAGLFYPNDARKLRETVWEYLRQRTAPLAPPPKALIVPHAGYVYSGAIAAAAYACVVPHRQRIRRVVLIGPSHRVYLRGMAVPSMSSFATPLGTVAIDRDLKLALSSLSTVSESDVPHAHEHSLEVQLPFLQSLLEGFTLLPLALGAATPAEVAAALACVWGDTSTLVLVSSDLSHYHGYEQARQIDAATSAAILRCEAKLVGEQTCGAVGINELLHLAAERGLQVREIARCNSGDTAGDKSRVVGYGAYAVYEPDSARAS